MFTGIITNQGTVCAQVPGAAGYVRLQIRCEAWEGQLQHGESIAVNGCCLTLVEELGGIMAFDVSTETLAKTALGTYEAPLRVNLERALSVGDRLGGHMVSGHIDTTGTIAAIEKRAGGVWIKLHIPAVKENYALPKGSIAVDGISLTINAVRRVDDSLGIELMLIPTTLALTNLGQAATGQAVNIEFDMIAKQIHQSLHPYLEKIQKGAALA